jgi:hypothetical protein
MDELREEMEAAWDASEKEGDDAFAEKEEKQGTTEEPEGEEYNSDAKLESEQPLDLEKEEKTHKDGLAEVKPIEKEVVADKASKAPASWSPNAREAWGKVPAAAQAQIAKRENEVNQVLQQSSEARKAAQSLNSVLAPHREGLQAAGYNDPFQAISTLFQTESGLRTGSNHDRAQNIANLISHYGVDIATLDGILSGQQQQQSNPNTQLEDMLDQRMAPFNQYMAQQQQQQQYGMLQQQEDANQQVIQFSADKEFIADVRDDMADLMDMAGKRGISMSLDQAYDKACAIHPDVSSVMQQRQKQQSIMGTHQNAVQKKAASVSLTGTQGGAGGLDTSMSLRDTIADAWNGQTG